MSHPPGGQDDDHGTQKQPKTHFWYFFPIPKSDTPLIKHQLLLVMTTVSAGLILVPPRTFGRQTILGGFTLFGINYLRYDWTGKTWSERTDPETAVLQKMVPMTMPDGAKAAQTQIRREKELRRIKNMKDEEEKKQALAWFIEKEKELQRIDGLKGDKKQVALFMLRVKEAEMKEARGEVEEYGFWKKLWMGGEKEGWELRRFKEHREILERGEGLWGAIKHDIKDAVEMVVGKPPAEEEDDEKEGEKKDTKVESKGEERDVKNKKKPS